MELLHKNKPHSVFWCWFALAQVGATDVVPNKIMCVVLERVVAQWMNLWECHHPYLVQDIFKWYGVGWGVGFWDSR